MDRFLGNNKTQSKIDGMLKHLFLLILSCIVVNSSYTQTSCEDFKDGKFRITYEGIGDVIIERKGDYQTEYHEERKYKVGLNVNWINDCTYTLKMDQILENPNNIDLPSVEGLIITVEILETQPTYYRQVSSSNISDFTVESKVRVVD